MNWSILLNTPDGVYFQDSVRYPFHIQFARARLPAYATVGALAYDLQVLYANESQRMVLEPVLRAPDPQVRELGIEITGVEVFPASRVVVPFAHANGTGLQSEITRLVGREILLVVSETNFKTLLLDSWLAPATGKGGGVPEFSTDSYFARTLLPGHHNFFEIVLIQPALDPTIPEATKAAFVAAHIRQIYSFKDVAGVTIGGDSEDIRFFGFDNSVCKP